MDLNRFRTKLKHALNASRALLSDSRQGKETFASVWDLENIIHELERIEYEIVTSSLPPKGQRQTIIGEIITGRHPNSSGGWPYDVDLTEELADVADLYCRKL